MIKIRVPATTANMGPGFDSIGMAFKLYNHIWVKRLASGSKNIIEIKSAQDGIPRDETNLIYVSMKRFYSETGIKSGLPPVHIIQEDYIPMTRGLGSSAACVVGGLVAANEISGKKFSKQQLANIAAKIEGHPDNSTPAIVGGIVVGAMDGNNLEYIKIDTSEIVKKGLSFSVMIPDFRLSTERARGVLPKTYTMKDAVFNSSRSALMVASLLTGNLNKLMVSMDDRIHQPYRKKIIPGMDEIFREAKRLGAKGVFLSGAGPTLIAVNDRPFFNVEMKDFLATLPNNWKLMDLEPDNIGVVIEKY